MTTPVQCIELLWLIALTDIHESSSLIVTENTVRFHVIALAQICFKLRTFRSTYDLVILIAL
jgi:hypothetical protein